MLFLNNYELNVMAENKPFIRGKGGIGGEHG
jgi:hypothetical protein